MCSSFCISSVLFRHAVYTTDKSLEADGPRTLAADGLICPVLFLTVSKMWIAQKKKNPQNYDWSSESWRAIFTQIKLAKL